MNRSEMLNSMKQDMEIAILGICKKYPESTFKDVGRILAVISEEYMTPELQKYLVAEQKVRQLANQVDEVLKSFHIGQ